MFEWLKNTAWPMVPWKAYGPEHLSFMIIGYLLSFFGAFKLRNMSKKALDRFLFGAGIFLALSELYKQLFYTVVIGNYSYQWWIFPFQLCSVPIYLCLLIPFVKNDKVKTAMYGFLVSYNLMGGFVAFIEPSGLIHEYWTLTIHAFIWHMSLVFIGLTIAFNKNSGVNKVSFKTCFMVFVCLCLIAFIINVSLWNVSKGDVNMFYVGPANSPIIVFKDIAAKYGWYINTPIYMAALSLAAYIFLLMSKKCNQFSLKH